MFFKKIIIQFWCFLLLGLLGYLCCFCQELQVPRRRPGYYDTGPHPELEVKLKLFKTSYLLREPIWVKVSVTNVGENEGKFYFTTGDGLVIEDSKGTVYPCNVHIGREPIKIKPQETLEKEVDIFTFAYGVSHDPKWKGFWYLPPEKYTIYYRLNQTVSSYRINVRSQVDSFEVLEPEDVELEAMSLLKESYDFVIKKEWEKSLSKLNDLVKKFPKSEYVPWALSRISATYRIHLRNLDKARNTSYMIINQYPNSREAVQSVKSIALHFANKKDKQQYIDAMNNLIKEYPNTDIAKEAENQLKYTEGKYFK